MTAIPTRRLGQFVIPRVERILHELGLFRYGEIHVAAEDGRIVQTLK